MQQFLRWFGLILMIFGLVTCPVMCYMRQTVVSTPSFQPSGGLEFSGGPVYPSSGTDQQTAFVFTVLIVISIIAFIVGFIALVGSGAHQKTERRAGKSGGKRRRKLPWKPPEGDGNL
jgi:hypothetical protein